MLEYEKYIRMLHRLFSSADAEIMAILSCQNQFFHSDRLCQRLDNGCTVIFSKYYNQVVHPIAT